MSPEEAWMSRPVTLLPDPQPLGQRANRRQRLNPELEVPLPPDETVDDRDGMALPGQVQGGGPATVAIATKDTDFHRSAQGRRGHPLPDHVLCMHNATIRRRRGRHFVQQSPPKFVRRGAAIVRVLNSACKGPSSGVRGSGLRGEPLEASGPKQHRITQTVAPFAPVSRMTPADHGQRDHGPRTYTLLDHHRNPLPHPNAHRAERVAPVGPAS